MPKQTILWANVSLYFPQRYFQANEQLDLRGLKNSCLPSQCFVLTSKDFYAVKYHAGTPAETVRWR
jgi:hypothetical protein